MVHNKRKRLILIVSAVVVVLLASIGTAVFIGSQSKEEDPYKYGETTNTADDTATNTSEKEDSVTKPSKDVTNKNNEDTTPLDPATVGAIDIEPLGVRVSYVKGAGGFEYQILRTPNGTQYVEFRSPELVGTKCTDDTGAFASVLANPQSNETSTLAKTTTIGDTKYGLSLASSTCTSDADKLKTYQNSFSDAFSLLKKLD